MNPDDEERLRAAARRFRSALESRGLQLLPELYEPFPTGWCGEASPLLAQYLTDIGFGDFEYVRGEREETDPTPASQSHGWLEQDGVIIDITADQFPEFNEPVVITRRSAWHDQFTERSRSAATDDYDSRVPSKLRMVYEELRRLADATDLELARQVAPSAHDFS